MGYIINPAEVRNWIWEVKSWLYEMEERYQSAFAIIKEFAENEGLEGNSYDKMKADFMIYHQLSVHGAGEVRGSIDRDLFILEGTIGEENLDEELLLEQIENQKAICRKCEDIIDNLTSLSRVPFMEYFLESLIEKYRILLAKAEGLLEDLEEKLERIYEINDNTARLFVTAADWLSAISSAIRDLQVCVTGKGNVSDGSWKDLLMPSFEEKVGKLEVFEGGSDVVNVKEELLRLLEQKNGAELVAEYLKRIRENNPDVHEFLEIVAFHESSGNYSAHREGSQFLGRYQIGNETFQQIGFKDKNGNWTALANSLGVTNEESFLKNETVQEVAIIFTLRWDYQFLLYYGNDEYIGTTVEGVALTESGLIASMHLIGILDTNEALRGQKSWADTKDDFGTPALKYIEEMGGLDLSSLWGGIE